VPDNYKKVKNIMRFLIQTQGHNTLSSTPSRLARLGRTLKATGIKELPCIVSYRSDKNGKTYRQISDAYTAPLFVKKNGTIVPFVDLDAKITFKDEMDALIDKVEKGLISCNEALQNLDILQKMFNV